MRIGLMIDFNKKRIISIRLLILMIFIMLSLYFSQAVFADQYSFEPVIGINKGFKMDKYTLNTGISVDESDFRLDELYLTTDFFKGELTVGRKYLKSGPGHFSQLMLSNQGTPLNLIMHEGQFTFEGIASDYRMMIAYLDEDSNKQLFHHRISNDSLIDGLEIGLSEAMIASEKINPTYYLPIPYLPYYLTAYISGLYNDYNSHDDKYLGIDFRYSFANEAQVYGELLVDELKHLSVFLKI